MNALKAKQIIESKLQELKEIEASWDNCSQCPNHGKCCDGAPISMWPEEWDKIQSFLKDNQDVKKYSISRFREKKYCYFYNFTASKCLISDFRPLNCIWTPHAIFKNHNLNGYLRDKDCNFFPIESDLGIIPIQEDSCIVKISNYFDSEVINRHYIVLQRIPELRELLLRNNEFESIDFYIKKFINNS